MLQWILMSSARLRLLMVFLGAVVIFVGGRQLRNMPVDVLPEFSEPYVEVQTEALGLSAIEVEQLITVPLEADLLNGVAWLDTIRSLSIPGLSSILLFFEPGTDILRARQMVQERLTQAVGLPHVSKPPVMLQPLSSTNRVMQIGLTARDISHIDMSVLTRWTIKPRLLGVPGVANVSVWGLRNRQLQVQVDPRRLREVGVTLNQVIKTAGDALWISPLTFLEASTPGTGGWVDTPNQRLGIRHLMPITSSKELAKVALADKTMALEDVADVVEDHQPLIGDAVVNDGPGLMLVVEKFPWANTLEVTRGVEQALDDMRPGLAGIEMDSTLFRPATYIELSLQNLAWSLPLGGVLMVTALFGFFYSWRFAAIGLVAITVSIAAAGLVLHLFGVTINLMILAGLAAALGVVVDDATVDTDHIAQRLRRRRSGDEGKSTARIVIEALGETRGTLFYATLISLLALVPVFFLEGLSGSFLRPLALAYALAILASMVVALTVTPALSVMLIDEESTHAGRSLLSQAARTRIALVASRILGAPSAAVAMLAVLLTAGVAASLLLGPQSLLPLLKENDLLVEWEGSPGTSRTAMSRVVANASRELRAVPGVRNVSAHLGRASHSDQVVDVNASEVWVSLDTSADYDATVARVREVVDGYPGLRHDVMTFLKERTSEAVTGDDDEIVVRVYGQDLTILRDMARAVQKSVASVSGIVDTRIEEQAEEASLEIKPDLARVRSHGLKPGDVRRAAATLLSGIEVGYIFEEQKVFDVVVWGTPETRHSISSVSELLIDTPGGQHVRLSDVADVRVTPAPMMIEREGVARYIDVNADVGDSGLAAVAADVDRLIKAMQFPLEYHAEVLGDYAERQAAAWRVLSLAIAAALGVFLLLQAAFGSWRLAAIAAMCVPAALVGSVLAVFATEGETSIGLLAGLLAVFAIAVRNSLFLVRRLQQIEREEHESFGMNLVLRGVRDRSVPIMMTAAITAVALLPFVIFGNIPGYEILHPMAIIILGGLVTSALVSLVIVPALYLRFGAGTEPEMALAGSDMEAM